MTREVSPSGGILKLENIVPNKDCLNVNSCKYEHRNCHRKWCHERRLAEQYPQDYKVIRT